MGYNVLILLPLLLLLLLLLPLLTTIRTAPSICLTTQPALSLGWEASVDSGPHRRPLVTRVIREVSCPDGIEIY